VLNKLEERREKNGRKVRRANFHSSDTRRRSAIGRQSSLKASSVSRYLLLVLFSSFLSTIKSSRAFLPREWAFHLVEFPREETDLVSSVRPFGFSGFVAASYPAMGMHNAQEPPRGNLPARASANVQVITAQLRVSDYLANSRRAITIPRRAGPLRNRRYNRLADDDDIRFSAFGKKRSHCRIFDALVIAS